MQLLKPYFLLTVHIIGAVTALPPNHTLWVYSGNPMKRKFCKFSNGAIAPITQRDCEGLRSENTFS